MAVLEVKFGSVVNGTLDVITGRGSVDAIAVLETHVHHRNW